MFISLAADALDEGGVRPDRPIPEEGLVERYLPECEFRGRDSHQIRYAVLAAVAWARAVSDQRGIALPKLCARLRLRAGTGKAANQ